MGRPSDFTPEMANHICEQLIEGKSLRKICSDEEMPNASTVCRWLSQNEAFREQYAHAREAQADTLADEILDIADDSAADVTVEDGREAINHEIVQRSRLRIDARKWLAAKMAPKRYGEAVQMKHTDGDGGPVQITSIVRTIVDPASNPDA